MGKSGCAKSKVGGADSSQAVLCANDGKPSCRKSDANVRDPGPDLPNTNIEGSSQVIPFNKKNKSKCKRSSTDRAEPHLQELCSNKEKPGFMLSSTGTKGSSFNLLKAKNDKSRHSKLLIKKLEATVEKSSMGEAKSSHKKLCEGSNESISTAPGANKETPKQLSPMGDTELSSCTKLCDKSGESNLVVSGANEERSA